MSKPDIAAFLAARYDEDEAAAEAAPGEEWHAFSDDDIPGASVYDDQWRLLDAVHYDHDNALSAKPGATGPQYIERSRDALAVHIARHDPKRVLREVAAGRKRLALHAGSHECPSEDDNCAWIDAEAICATVRADAEVFSDHPDYDRSWQPEGALS